MNGYNEAIERLQREAAVLSGEYAQANNQYYINQTDLNKAKAKIAWLKWSNKSRELDNEINIKKNYILNLQNKWEKKNRPHIENLQERIARYQDKTTILENEIKSLENKIELQKEESNLLNMKTKIEISLCSAVIGSIITLICTAIKW